MDSQFMALMRVDPDNPFLTHSTAPLPGFSKPQPLRLYFGRQAFIVGDAAFSLSKRQSVTDTTYILGQPQLLIPMLIIGAGFAVLLIRTYWQQSQAEGITRGLCIALKLTGFGILTYCLLEPLIRGTRPTPGENIFVVLADRSQSLNIKNRDSTLTRGDKLSSLLKDQKSWLARLGQEFDTRKYWIGTKLQSVDSFQPAVFEDLESRLNTGLATVAKRLENQPVAGVLFFTDGNTTDHLKQNSKLAKLPPIYPVILGNEDEIPDLEVTRVSVTQSNFEAAPLRITAQVNSRSPQPKLVLAELLDETGNVVETQKVEIEKTEQVTFKVKPDREGIRFYTVAASYEEDFQRILNDQPLSEATLQNNSQTVVVDRGGGPYRVLYVSGRPNWEFKFLNRALAKDREVQLVGLIRIAKKKPKFDFRRKGET
ncbi:MAG: hypothetical protein VX438_04405, partial [Planctomycetota bacterium]|nr:hypothetical protein [Planctomycetota bacterium]